MAFNQTTYSDNEMALMNNPPLEKLVEILELDQLGVDKFAGHSPQDSRKRIFGGQVAAQALVAAGRTVECGTPNSLHAYFLRPGDISLPIVFDIDRVRDGSSFTTRRIIATQRDEIFFTMFASFHKHEESLSHQLPMPQVPDPETLPTFKERMAPWADQMGDWNKRMRPLEQRYVDTPQFDIREKPREPKQYVWVRADGKLPDDPLLHAAIMTYATDMSLLDTIMLPNQVSRLTPNLMLASLDHSVWFHGPFRVDEWFLFDQESPVSYGGRALVRGNVFSREGNLIVSVAQEGLFRLIGYTGKNS